MVQENIIAILKIYGGWWSIEEVADAIEHNQRATRMALNKLFNKNLVDKKIVRTLDTRKIIYKIRNQ